MRMRNTPESEPRPSTCTYLIARAKNTFSSLNRIQTEKFVAPVAAKREETRENAAPSQLKEKHLSVAFTVAAASCAEPAYDETILLRGSPREQLCVPAQQTKSEKRLEFRLRFTRARTGKDRSRGDIDAGSSKVEEGFKYSYVCF